MERGRTGSSWARVITALKASRVRVGGAASGSHLLPTMCPPSTAVFNWSSKGQSWWWDTPMPRGHSSRASCTGQGPAYVTARGLHQGEKVADVFYRLEPHPQAPKLLTAQQWPHFGHPEEAFASALHRMRLRTTGRPACWGSCSDRYRPPASPSPSGPRFGRRSELVSARRRRPNDRARTQRYMAGDEGEHKSPCCRSHAERDRSRCCRGHYSRSNESAVAGNDLLRNQVIKMSIR